MEDARLELEKWHAELALKKRELDLKERQAVTSEAELVLKQDEARGSRWRNPLIIAILGAVAAALGSAGVSLVNGLMVQSVEEKKAESALILEMIKTNDAKKATQNLKFLIDTGLVRDVDRQRKIEQYLKTHQEGGPVLPAAGRSRSQMIIRGIPEDRVEQTMEGWRREGAVVVKVREPDGSYTVTAQFP